MFRVRAREATLREATVCEVTPGAASRRTETCWGLPNPEPAPHPGRPGVAPRGARGLLDRRVHGDHELAEERLRGELLLGSAKVAKRVVLGEQGP